MSPPQQRNRNRQGTAAARNNSAGGSNAGGAEPPAPPPKPPAAERDSKANERIGDILKRERERRGDDLQQIADYLCIRRAFLEAIENNRYDELPADAYVIGFLRSYAALLGLDGADAIDRYRKEMIGRRRRPELSVPTPIAEGRTPSAAIMISAAVAALVIYAIWYALSSSDRSEVSTAPSLPVATTSSPASPNAAASEGAIVPENAPPSGITVTADSSAATIPSIQLTPTTSAPAAAEATTSAASTAPVVPIEPPKAATAATAATTSAAATPEQPLKADAAPTPHVFGDTNSDSRISVRAEKESWILIADEKGHTVFDRVLKPGDVYHAPDIDGLTLTAGNGNGIVINLDGEDLPKLASHSAVLRAVPLDPDKLKQ